MNKKNNKFKILQTLWKMLMKITLKLQARALQTNL